MMRLCYLLLLLFAANTLYGQPEKDLVEKWRRTFFTADSSNTGLKNHRDGEGFWQTKNGNPTGQFYYLTKDLTHIYRSGYFDSIYPHLLTGPYYSYEHGQLAAQDVLRLGVATQPFNALAADGTKGFTVIVRHTGRDTLITCPMGTQLHIRQGTFNRHVVLTVREIYGIQATMFNNLSTGLETGESAAIDQRGMVFIGTDVAAQKPITVIVPAKHYALDAPGDSVTLCQAADNRFSPLYWQKTKTRFAAASNEYTFNITAYGWYALGKRKSEKQGYKIVQGHVKDLVSIEWPGLNKKFYRDKFPVYGFAVYPHEGIILRVPLSLVYTKSFLTYCMAKLDKGACFFIVMLKHPRKNTYYLVSKPVTRERETIQKKDVRELSPDALKTELQKLFP